MPYDEALALQEALRAELLAGRGSDTLLLCEHDPVITLGRGARPEHVRVSAAELDRRGVAVRPASRGGDVTYHGPGQLVGYPVFRLRRGPVAHMETMATALAELVAPLGLVARWRRDRPGLWVGGDKICAFGIHVRHRVAIHGFALNVTTTADDFAIVVPCGLADAGVTSIAALCGPARAPALPALASATAAAFARVFERELGPCARIDLLPGSETDSALQTPRAKP